MSHWALVVADYQREYQKDQHALAGLSLEEFLRLLRGLSKYSRFAEAWREAPKHMHDPADRAALIEAARR